VASHALKFDPSTIYGNLEKIEQRSDEEVWKNSPRGVHIFNNVFDFVPSIYISATITEFGVLTYDDLLDKIKEKYPWL